MNGHPEPGTFDVRELHERSDPEGRLTVDKLQRWLLDEGLATPNGEPGRLVPTQKAFDVVAALSD